jgi:hypothetical protein
MMQTSSSQFQRNTYIAELVQQIMRALARSHHTNHEDHQHAPQ